MAEGYGKRRSSRQFRSYVENALGSTDEMIVHLQVALTLEYVTEQEAETFDRGVPNRGQNAGSSNGEVAMVIES